MKQKSIQEIFTHLPTLESERLLFRPILPEDAEDMYAYSCQENVTAYLLWEAHPDLPYTASYIQYLQERYALGDYYDWAIISKKEKKMIGTVGFTNIDCANNCAEIGYVIHPDYWGCGYATEAAKEILRFGFLTMGLSRISGVCMKENKASLRVMIKCGMQYEGTMRSAIVAKGRRRDVCVAAITREDFEENK
ncbi:MAG: GNAT family N-acetyltransferase [Clostridia bacterium]|nr:GNAT family N-acetyltransferase [Clostridia bacterium]